MPDIPPPSVAYGRFAPEDRVDHWLEMRWQAPATMLLEIGVDEIDTLITDSGVPDHLRDAGASLDFKLVIV